MGTLQKFKAAEETAKSSEKVRRNKKCGGEGKWLVHNFFSI